MLDLIAFAVGTVAILLVLALTFILLAVGSFRWGPAISGLAKGMWSLGFMGAFGGAIALQGVERTLGAWQFWAIALLFTWAAFLVLDLLTSFRRQPA